MADPSSRWSASPLASRASDTSGTSHRPRARAIGLLTSAILSIATVACQDPGGFKPPPAGGTGGQHTGSSSTGPGTGASGGSTVLGGPCEAEGETRACHEIIGQHAGIINCFNGTQTCHYGVWGLCEDGAFALKFVGSKPGAPSEPAGAEGERVARADLHLHPLQDAALTAGEGQLQVPLNATDTLCGDPCDPTCHTFVESNSFTISGQGLVAWAGAGPNALPNAKTTLTAAAVAWKEPCTIGTDCQFGMYCQNPITANQGTGAGQCSHNKCAVGTAMSATCGDACVAAVCAVNSNCCTYTGACTPHAPCVTGNVLTCQATDACVNTVCAAAGTAHCCDIANPVTPGWDAACVAAYSACRPVACPSDPINRAWDSKLLDPAVGNLACTQLVHDLCGLNCPNTTPACDHDICAIGSGLAAGCDTPGTCVAAVCTANSACCGTTGTWSQACVDLVPQVCGQYCKGASLSGKCATYLPNEVDLACKGPDLVVEVPCYDTTSTAQPPTVIPTGVCASDAACGSLTSGIVCDQTTANHYCASGCRGTGGNGCPTGQTCSSGTASIGTCSGFKVPGNSTAAPYVVICNNGTKPTPLGAPVVVNVYPSGTMATTSPLTQPPATSPKVSCTTASLSPSKPQILPGKCVDLPCATAAGDEVFVNPPTAAAPNATTTQVQECQVANNTWDVYANNWAINLDTGPAVNQKVTCDSPLCSATNTSVFSHPTHMLIEMESSGSLVTLPLGEWTAIKAGVGAFLDTFTSSLSTATSSSVEVGLFPDPTTACINPTNCGGTSSCVKTTPGWKVVANNAGNIATLKAAIPAAATGGNPPYVLALAGALAAAAADLSTSLGAWNESVVMVLGSPITATSSCNSTVASMAGLAAQYFQQYGIRTHVIAIGTAGLPNSQLADAQVIASAGGGQATYVQNSILVTAPQLASNITTALSNAFLYSDQSCIFSLPSTALYNASSSQVRLYAPSAPGAYKYTVFLPVPQQLPVSLATFTAQGKTYLDACLAACSSNNGWCYDDPVKPTEIVLCPQSCQAVVDDPWPTGHGIGIFNLACPQYFADFTYPISNPYQGICAEPGTKPLWSYLAYNTIEPNANTNVDFTIQTGNLVGGACPDPVSMAAAYATQSPDVIASINTTVSSPGAGCAINGGQQACTVPAQCGSGTCTGGLCVCTMASQCASGNCDATGHCACPVDLVKKYNGGSINGPMLADCLNLSVALNPDGTHTNTPTVNGFELRYSCPFTE